MLIPYLIFYVSFFISIFAIHNKMRRRMEKIEIEEKVTRFVIGGGMNVRDISDIIQMETMELVQRAYTDHVTGRTAISAFCRPVTVE